MCSSFKGVRFYSRLLQPLYTSGLTVRVVALIIATSLFMLESSRAFGMHVMCGDTIIDDTVLDSNLIDCPGDGIIIGADNIKLDCDGHTIAGPSSGNGIDLRTRTHVTIRNCSVTNFRFGFILIASDGNTLVRNAASNNTINGFEISSSSGNTLVDNTALGNANGYVLRTSFDNILKRNTASIGSNGFFLTASSSGNTLENNTADGNNFEGYILVNSDGNLLEENVSSGNGSQGIRFFNSNDNILKRNDVSGNKLFGIRLQFSSFNRLFENKAVGSENQCNFCLESSSNNNILEENVAGCIGGIDAKQVDSTGNVFVDNEFCTTIGIP